jgi:2-succinyl-6-hydroxy-2,4-cyclohexadiene-1-carboxylate synthase
MLLDQDIERIFLVGYSLGGRLALYFNLAYPEKVTRLVLESANPGISDPYERQQRATRDQVLSEQILENGIESFLNEWYDLPLFKSLKRFPELKAELRRKRGQQSPQDMSTVLGALSPGRQPDLWPLLSKIQVPTLLIGGRLDQKYTGIIREMNQVLPNSQMILLDGCGHNVHRECPDPYLKELRDWLYQIT